MIEIEHILDQEPIEGQGRAEELVDPLIDPLAHPHRLAFSRGAMSGHNHAGLRQPLTQC
jgi:hypothetical protein